MASARYQCLLTTPPGHLVRPLSGPENETGLDPRQTFAPYDLGPGIGSSAPAFGSPG
jgi:hypothetical protein